MASEHNIPEHKIPELTPQLARRILVAQFRLIPDGEIRERYPGEDMDPDFLRKLYIHFRVLKKLDSRPDNYIEKHYIPWFIKKYNLHPEVYIRNKDISTPLDRSAFASIYRATIYGYRIQPGPLITEYKMSYVYDEEDVCGYEETDYMPSAEEYPEVQLSTFEFISKYGFHIVELLHDDFNQIIRSMR